MASNDGVHSGMHGSVYNGVHSGIHGSVRNGVPMVS